jgi:NDP-sugar pyrophosphorylase family protein
LLDILTDTFAILFGDNLSTCNLEKMLDLHRSNGADATIALYRREDVRASGVAEIEPDDRIRRFIEKPSPEQTASRWVNAGIIFAQPVLLRYVPRERPSDLGRDVIPAMLSDGCSIFGYRMTEQLHWIDTPEDYERTSSALR